MELFGMAFIISCISACVRCGSALASTGGRGPLVPLPYRHTQTFWRNSAFTNLSK